MSIDAQIPTPYGVTAGYWIATEAAISLRSRQVTVTARGWLDETAFLDGRQPLDQRVVSFGPADLDMLPGSAEMEISALIELLLRTTPEFAETEA